MTSRLLYAGSICLLGVFSGPALAHAHLQTATPPADGTVASGLAAIELDFSEGVNLRFTGVAITGPDGTAVATGEASHGPKGDAALLVPISTPLTPGRYRVDWHALASDGHKTSGSYAITVRP